MRLCILILLLYLVITTATVVVFFLLKSERQVFKRIFRHVKPCPFGVGTHFETVDKLNGQDQHFSPQILFTTCLFGVYSDTFHNNYVTPLYAAVERVHTFMPTAQVRVYLAQSLPQHIQKRLLELKCQVHLMSPDPVGFEGTMWRFYAADEETLPFISIDADDDTVTQSFIQEVKHWLDSDKQFFVKRHHLSSFLPMTAGRWGAKPGALKNINMKELTESYCDYTFGVDEGFLNREVWPHAQDSVDETSIDGREIAIIIGIIFSTAVFLLTLYYACKPCAKDVFDKVFAKTTTTNKKKKKTARKGAKRNKKKKKKKKRANAYGEFHMI